jgi:hypothetical protein
MSETETLCEKLKNCPLGNDSKIEEVRKLFDQTAIMLHDIMYIKVKDNGSDEKEYTLPEILKWVLEATETKRKILQTERLWKKSKWLIATFTIIKRVIVPALLIGIFGILWRISISMSKIESIDNGQKELRNELFNHINAK